MPDVPKNLRERFENGSYSGRKKKWPVVNWIYPPTIKNEKNEKFFFGMIYWFVTNNFSWLLSCYAGIVDHKTLDLFLNFRSLNSWSTWTFLPFYCLFGFTSLGKNQNPAKGPVFKPQVVRISFKGIFSSKYQWPAPFSSQIALVFSDVRLPGF